MHCHSTRSDGKNTPQEVLQEGVRQKLDFLALTDHDIIAPKEFQDSLWSEWIESCDSVEISARNYDLEKSLHLVSYAKIFRDSLREVLDESKKWKMSMKWGQFYKMIYEFWFEGSKDWFDEYMRNQWRKPATSNKYDISRYFFWIWDNPIRMREILWELLTSNDVVARFYEECFKREWKLYEKYWFEARDYEPSVEDTVEEVAEKSRGIVALAHPNVTFSEHKWWIPEFERTIGDYVDKWVNAIEINAKASAEWISQILEIWERYDLILTFWSDCHSIWYDGRDGKHGTIWQINPLIETEIYEQNFWRFEETLWI